MNRRVFIAVFAAAYQLLASDSRASATVSGTVISCNAEKRYHLPNISVLIFDGSQSQKLNELIEKADTAAAASTDDIKVAETAWKASDQLVAFARNAPNIGGAKSDSSGSFRVSLARRSKSAIVFVYARSEEGPQFEYAYTRVSLEKMTAPVIVSFTPGCG